MKNLLIGLMALCCAGTAQAQTETPKYGGTLDIGTVYVTLNALSFDPADWVWKMNHDTGNYLESPFVGDLNKSTRLGGTFPFHSDAWLPTDVIKGELVEAWRWKENPLRVEMDVRPGVMFPEKEGVMKARELTAQDFVFSYYYVANSSKAIPHYFDHVEKVEATGPRQVTFTFKEYNADWDYRFGWGYYGQIIPKELVDAGIKDWKNATGTGPFQLSNYTAGNSTTYVKNPIYWDKEKIGGQEYKLPFVDKVIYHTIKDEASWIAALRTGKLDMLESIRWQNVESLKKSTPALKWSRWLAMSGTFLSLRVDTKPFDDIRVRRALNYAVNKKEIVTAYYGGEAELFGYPQHPEYIGYWEPLSDMPASVKELFEYDPAKAKKLLAEAGYPKGFSFKVQVCACNPDHMDLLPLVAAYLEQVGVKIEIQPMEYGAYLSAMTTKTNTAGYFMNNGHTSPTRTLGKSFTTKEVWNPSQWTDPAFDAAMADIYATRDETERQKKVKALTRDILDKAPYIWLPTPYLYTAWWPWVKNYGGELRAAAVKPGPVYARIWVDQDMKKKLGH